MPTINTTFFCFFFLLLFLLTSSSNGDPFSLVFKGCSNQTLPDAALPSLASLSTSLLSQSAGTRFAQSTTDSSPRLTALFQCRGDLPLSSCASCVRRIPSIWSDLCPLASAARVHLSACYALYQLADSAPRLPSSVLFRRCSPSLSAPSEVSRDQAFARLQSSAAAAGGTDGFYDAGDGGWQAAAQCQEDLSVADCGECVSEAVQRAEVECGAAAGGQVYLDNCFVVYGIGDDGAEISVVGNTGSGINGFGGYSVDHGGDSSRSGEQTQKTVAIVVGGAAGLGFLVIFVLFLRSLYKKEEYYST